MATLTGVIHRKRRAAVSPPDLPAEVRAADLAVIPLTASYLRTTTVKPRTRAVTLTPRAERRTRPGGLRPGIGPGHGESLPDIGGRDGPSRVPGRPYRPGDAPAGSSRFPRESAWTAFQSRWRGRDPVVLGHGPPLSNGIISLGLTFSPAVRRPDQARGRLLPGYNPGPRARDT